MPDDMNVQQDFPELRAGLQLMSADGHPLGKVLEVLRDVGSVEAFGKAGIPPQQHDFDPAMYGYSDAMPGAGDNYFVARGPDREILYVPFSAVREVSGDQVIVIVDAEDLRDVNWMVRPDVLAAMPDDYPEDEGGEPLVA